MLTSIINPALQYSASMDSVKLINSLMAKPSLTEKEHDCIARNVEHLEVMVAKDYWTTENLEPLTNAIAAGKS